MRIVGGELRNRSLYSPKGQDIRPTGERVREAIFNILYARMDLNNLIVADICCGTGALGIEALSRGAEHCTFVDLDTKAVSENIKTFNLKGQATVIRSLGQKVRLMNPVDLIFLDPPYYKELGEEVMKNADNLGKAGTIWIVEVESKHVLDYYKDKFSLISDRRYGHSKIYILEQK